MLRTDYHQVLVFAPTLCKTIMDNPVLGRHALVSGRITYEEGKNSSAYDQGASIVAHNVIFFQ